MSVTHFASHYIGPEKRRTLILSSLREFGLAIIVIVSVHISSFVA
jgi:hypothetical protein